jgi:hypothetical protein
MDKTALIKSIFFVNTFVLSCITLNGMEVTIALIRSEN